jgi:hypothetical protein
VQVVTPTVESVCASRAWARQFIEARHLCLEATIDDNRSAVASAASAGSKSSGSGQGRTI